MPDSSDVLKHSQTYLLDLELLCEIVRSTILRKILELSLYLSLEVT